MTIERTRQRFLLLAAAFLLFITFVDAFKCPDHCSCMEIQRPRHSYNHAKCTSLDGLRQLGKTSDIHSLDLSGLNLTKITNQLDKLTNLTRLDLSNNRLSEVSNLKNRLRVLVLSNNRITSGKLTKIPASVRHLNLTNNAITYLPLEFESLVHLKSLELAGNPLNCTCETLQVRNVLQERNVWTDQPILCMVPFEFKGLPWLQIRQSDACDANGLEEPRTLPFAGADNENELMQGDDQNVYTGGDASVEEKNDELGAEFMPVIDKRAKRTDAGLPIAAAATQNAVEINSDFDDISDDDYDDGSGATFQEEDPSTTVSTAVAFTDEVYEGSGDDGAHVPAFHLSDETETTTAEPTDTEESTSILAVAAESENVEHSTEPEQEDTTAPALLPAVEERIFKVDAVKVDTELVHPDLLEEPAVHTEADNVGLSSSAPIRSDGTEHATASFSDSNNAYILLAILGILLVLLIVFVASKRSRNVSKNRRDNDIEHASQELSNMDKNNLGKPIAEFIPLIPGRYPDKENNLSNAQEPLLKKLNESDAESNPSANDLQEEPKIEEDTKQQNGNVAPGTPSTTPIQNGIHKDENDGHVFQSISPKPSRYSPVS